VRAAQAHISKTQTTLFSLFFVALLPRLGQKLVRLKDKIALARLSLIPAMQDRPGFIQRHLAPLRHPANILMPQFISKPCIDRSLRALGRLYSSFEAN
jgi:hypothetical protein